MLPAAAVFAVFLHSCRPAVPTCICSSLGLTFRLSQGAIMLAVLTHGLPSSNCMLQPTEDENLARVHIFTIIDLATTLPAGFNKQKTGGKKEAKLVGVLHYICMQHAMCE